MTAPSPTSPGEPRRLGSAYVLTSLIGTGAQGEVWLGRRVDGPAINLAVKLLRADLLQDPGVIERFVRERATLMRVRSPYVVGVQDMVVEGDSAAIVMDHVGGGDMRGLLEAWGTMPPAEVARVGALLAEGLSVVHSAGVVHRDVKPANVLIDVVDTSGASAQAPAGQAVTTWIPRLADFGVARICSTVASSKATGAIGTPLYMAPEILDVHAPTPAADIYSLGIVLYEAACGVPPFVGAPSQVLGQHARRAPGRPQGIPDSLWMMIERMLAKRPEARPAASEIAQTLTAVAPSLAGLPAAPRAQEPPPSTPSTVPYMWSEESESAPGEETVAPTAPTTGTAPTVVDGYAPTLVAPSTPAGATVGETVAVSPSPGQATISSASAADAAAPRRRRRRPLIVAGIAAVVVVCLVLVAGGLFLWQRHRSQAALAGTFASLPSKAKVVELRHITDVSDYVSSPGGGALAVKSSSDWSLYDLDSSDQAPTWTGKCDKVRFWNNTTLACKGTSDAMTLVSLDGSTSDDVPGPAGHQLMGSDGERAVLIEGDTKGTSSSQGSLVAIDKDGKESWRSEGHFSKARVRNGFVLAYEGHSKRLYVLSAATGDVLYSQAADTAPDFGRAGSGSRDPGPGDEYFEPGGINLDAGTNAFVVRGSSSATVYDSKGDQVAVISSDTSQDPAWAISANREAKDFADDLSKVEGASGAFAVVGAGASVPVEADAGSCEATRTDKKVVFTPPEGACTMRPMGLIGGDSAALFAMGSFTSSTSGTSLDATDAYAVAYDLKTGEQLWQAAGIPARALPPSSNASGNAAGQPRMLMLRGTSSSGELVIDAVVPN